MFIFQTEFTFDIISIISRFFEAGLDQRNNLLIVQRQTFDPGEISTNVFKLYFYFLFSPIFNFGSVRDLFLSAENLALSPVKKRFHRVISL